MKAIAGTVTVIACVAASLFVVLSSLNRQRQSTVNAGNARQKEIVQLRVQIARKEANLRATRTATRPDAEILSAGSADGRREQHLAALREFRSLVSDHAIQLGTLAREIITPNAAGVFPPQFTIFFDLDEQETERLRTEMISIKSRLEELIAAASTVTRAADGSLEIFCGPITGGQELRAELNRLVRDVLGEERFATLSLLNLDSSAFNDFYGSFGENGSMTTISRTAEGTYSVRRNSAVPGRSIGSLSMTARNRSREQLLELIGPQARQLPTDF